MKKLYTLSFMLVTALSFGQYIPFNGTGELTANGWVQTGTPTAPATDFPGHLQTLTTPSDNGNSLSFLGLPASTGNRTTTTHNNTQDANYAVGPYSSTTYYSALIKPTSVDAMFANTNASGEYFLHMAATAGTGAGTFVARIYVKKGATDGTFVLGVLNGSGGTATPTFSAAEYTPGTTYFVVVKYDLAANSATLYVNPVPGLPEPVVASATNNTGTGAAPAQIAAMCIRQSGGVTATNSTGNIEIDEIRVGSTFASVAPGFAAGVNQNSIAGLKVFPNPVTNGTLFIETTNSAELAVAVYDVLGKQVLNTKTATNAVNVSSLKGGVYIVKITENGQTATRKLVIK